MEFFKTKKGSLIMVILCIVISAAVFGLILFTNKDRSQNGVFYSMDTIIETIGEDDVKDEVKDIFTRFESIFDMHSDKSELSKLNNAGSMKVSAELLSALKRCGELCKEYGDDADITIGAVTKLWNITGKDPKVPSDDEIKKALETVGMKNILINGDSVTLENGAQIDMGCCAKGAALDEVKNRLDKKYKDQNNKKKTIVSAGSSSIMLYGDSKFETAVLSPDSDSERVGTLKTDAGFISTSGGYHRFTEIDGKKYIHIFDTKTGKPSDTDLTSVTVFCDSGIDSDMLSTMIFAGGTEKIGDYLKNDKIQIAAIDKDNNVYVSENAEFTITDKDKYKIAEK